ncbi:MAG: mechanosensitive ion channel [Polaromonas sp.]|nr:mechanosensitive ion channel [Gemmatimonadaceae bacterium]
MSVAALLALSVYGVWFTGRERARVGSLASPTTSGATITLTDDGTLTTALTLVKLPTTIEELPLAQDALRLADREMDLAFADAVRQLAAHPQQVTPETHAIAERLAMAQRQHATDSMRVAELEGADASAAGSGQLDLAKARLEVSQDEMDDAGNDLIHAGGDPQGRVQALVQEHADASRNADSLHIKAVPPLDPDGLIQTGRGISALRLKDLRLQEAIASSEAIAASMDSTHQRLDVQVADTTRKDSMSLEAVRRRALEYETGAGAGRRRANQLRLAKVYADWIQVVKEQERALEHDALRDLVLILCIIMLWIYSDTLVARVLVVERLERRSAQRLRVVARVSLQAVGILLILIITFGTPNNLGTILGLAGAGLTVALKDFIVSFMGWLVLMGRHGVRIADLVEINGVTGEVEELGLFNTVLQETGNWTDAGHLTGRRVTFTNSYAIEGHYFNFSTSGQWLWDEVRIAVPAGKDPYRIVESLQKRVQEMTAENAKRAEREWTGASRSPGPGTIAAAPAMTIKPIMGGVEVTLRFITHAAERYDVRAKLYQAAVGVLGEATPLDDAKALPGAVESPS